MLEIMKNALPKMFDNLPIFPEQASTIAGEVDLLMVVWTLVSLAAGTPIVLVMLYLMVRYQRRNKGETGGAEFHAPLVEIISMVIPFVVAMSMFAWGAKVFVDMKRPPANAIEYFAFGKQWMWKYQHPNGMREINDLTIPVNTPIKMTMTSEDVIHAFYVPAFRVKQDVLPGRYVSVWFEATRVGVYRQLCAEYCGTEHSLMGGRVHVLSQEDYEQWLLDETLVTPPASTGEQLFTSLACSTCHTGEDSGRGPTLHGVSGHPVPLATGESVIADDSFLRESILEPQARVRAGYAALMPTYQGQVTEEQLFDLVAYIKTLGSDELFTDETKKADTRAARVADSPDEAPIDSGVATGG